MAVYLPEFGDVYLEDSCFLGIVAEGRNLRLRMLFVLTRGHPNFAMPSDSEGRCYREGSLLAKEPRIVSWQAGKPTVSIDPDGTYDFDSLQLFQLSPTRFRILTEWFDAVLETPDFSVEVP